MSVQIHITNKVKLKNPVLIEGFPGMGLVGTIAASYLVEKLNMDFVGYITSDKFPPIAAVHDYKPLYPARIYADKKHNLIVILSEFIVPIPSVLELSEAIVQFSKKSKVSQIISLGAIAQKGEEGKVFCISTRKEVVRKLVNKKDVELVKEGATTGVTGVLLARGAVEKFDVVSLLSQSHEEYMDPLASAAVLKTLKKYLNLKFDTKELENEAQEVETKMKELISKAKEAHAHYEKTASESVDLHGMYR